MATHDCWPPYFNYDTCSHNLCRAHLLREAIAIGKAAGEFTWMGQMKSLLKEMKFEVDNACADSQESSGEAFIPISSRHMTEE